MLEESFESRNKKRSTEGKHNINIKKKVVQEVPTLPLHYTRQESSPPPPPTSPPPLLLPHHRHHLESLQPITQLPPPCCPPISPIFSLPKHPSSLHVTGQPPIPASRLFGHQPLTYEFQPIYTWIRRLRVCQFLHYRDDASILSSSSSFFSYSFSSFSSFYSTYSSFSSSCLLSSAPSCRAWVFCRCCLSPRGSLRFQTLLEDNLPSPGGPVELVSLRFFTSFRMKFLTASFLEQSTINLFDWQLNTIMYVIYHYLKSLLILTLTKYIYRIIFYVRSTVNSL